MKTISILTPIRKRPQLVLRMINSIRETMSFYNLIEIVFRADLTDEIINNDEFIDMLYQLENSRVDIQFIFGPETFPDLGCLWNECYSHCSGDIVQIAGDDLIYKTKDWDKKVVEQAEKFPDEIYLIWGEDGTFGPNLATHPFVSRRWVESIGWLTPPCGLTYANDNAVFEIAVKVNRRHFLCDLLIQHEWQGSNPDDPNVGRMLANHRKDNDFLQTKEGQEIINGAVERLKGVMR